ncbi:hypothetical protein AB0Q95_36135 [Streptomyces sp. NPDC059900]|uniref:hypothetical protein n=1 Tax=Streptomyces sp. NPDC059900 TaxID=3155816 RepID=UPI003426AA68
MTSNGNEEDRIEGLLAHFGTQATTPVLSFLDADDPVSLRCHARWTRGTFLVMSVLPDPGSQAVAANLLWHHHDEKLEDQRSMMLPGTLEPGETPQSAERVFRPTAEPVLMGLGPVDVDALFRRFHKASDTYLERHSQEPPHIDWEAFEKLIAEVRAKTPEH